MDPLSIGAAVVTLLTPYVADAGKEFVTAVGEAGLEKTKELLHWLKAKFAGDPVAAKDLSRFEKNPAGYATPLQETIDAKVKEDPAFSAEVARRMNDLGPFVTIVITAKNLQNVRGVRGNVAAGTVAVTIGGDVANDVIGIDGRIG
jgi:hypothetical protein